MAAYNSTQIKTVTDAIVAADATLAGVPLAALQVKANALLTDCAAELVSANSMTTQRKSLNTVVPGQKPS